jgi:LacI family transcriptional regulator
MGGGMSTVKEIAEVSGFSYVSVAQILQGKTNYKASTISKVKSLAEEMGYVPNFSAKALAGSQSMSIGVYMSSLDNPFETEILKSIEKAAVARGYSTIMSCSNTNDRRAAIMLAGVLKRGVDGLIFFNTMDPVEEIAGLLRGCGIPVVYVDKPLDDSAPLVSWDYTFAWKALAEIVAARGFRRACFLGNPYKLKYPERMVAPLADALSRHGVKLLLQDSWTCGDGADYEKLAYEVVKYNLSDGKSPPELLLAHNGYAALGAIAALTDLGFEVPKDVAVAACDDTRIAPYLRPRLAGVFLRGKEKLGGMTFDLLETLMTSEDAEKESKVLVGEFQNGGTLG